jgi:hypothetical protein
VHTPLNKCQKCTRWAEQKAHSLGISFLVALFSEAVSAAFREGFFLTICECAPLWVVWRRQAVVGSLQELCRQAVRAEYGPQRVHALATLPLTETCKSYLVYHLPLLPEHRPSCPSPPTAEGGGEAAQSRYGGGEAVRPRKSHTQHA